MSAVWWKGIAPVVARLSCDGREHELRWRAGELLAPSHPDLGAAEPIMISGSAVG